MKSYECTIFMGSVRLGLKGTRFSEQDVIEEIKYFQSMNIKRKTVIRITKIKYIFMHYEEDGFEISAIQYPRFPQTDIAIRAFMKDLTKHLKSHFQQLSISISDSEQIDYLGEEDEHSSQRW